MNDFRLHQLRPCGKLFVSLFCMMVLTAMIWMAFVQITESGLYTPNKDRTLAEINPSEDFKKEYPEPGWIQFIDNAQYSLARLTVFASLYFAIGTLLYFTSYPCKFKKTFYWLTAIFIFLYIIAILGYEFCWTAMFLTHFCGSATALLLFIMTLMIVVNMRGKGNSEPEL